MIMRVFLVLAALVPGLAGAAVWHAAPGGLDSQPGTPERPFQTLQRALDQAAPGDTVRLAPGGYDAHARTRAPRVRIEGAGVSTVLSNGLLLDHRETWLAGLRLVRLGVVVGQPACVISNCMFGPGAQAAGTNITCVSTPGRPDEIQCPGLDFAQLGFRKGDLIRMDNLTKAGGGAHQVAEAGPGRLVLASSGGLPSPERGSRLWLGLPSQAVNNSRITSSNLVIVDNLFTNVAYTVLLLYGNGHLVARNTFLDTPWDTIYFFGNNIVARNNFFYRIGENSHVGPSPAHIDLFQTWGQTARDPALSVTNFLFEKNFVRDCDCQIGHLETKKTAEEWNWVRDVTVRNNIFVDVNLRLNSFVAGTRIYNNTFVRCEPKRMGVIYFGNSFLGVASGSAAWNNAFVACGSLKLIQGEPYILAAPDADVDYNFACRNNSYMGRVLRGFKEPHGINGGNPGLVNLDGVDPAAFALAGTNSILYKQGRSIDGFADDFFGNPRNPAGPWDIGAVEFQPSRPGAVLKAN